MTTDKPKWWQSWMVYTLIGLLLTLGPYVGGYFLLRRHHSLPRTPYGSTSIMIHVGINVRQFDYEILRIAFGPLGWAEAQIRGGHVIVSGPGDVDPFGPRNHDFYEPGW